MKYLVITNMKINVIVIAGNVGGGGAGKRRDWMKNKSVIFKIMKTYSVRACISLTLNI